MGEMTVDIFGIKIKRRSGWKGMLLMLILAGIFLAIIPLIVIWTVNLLFGMGWKYTLEYWFAVIVLLLLVFSLKPSKD